MLNWQSISVLALCLGTMLGFYAMGQHDLAAVSSAVGMVITFFMPPRKSADQ